MSVMRAARMCVCVCVCGWRAGCVPLLVHLIHDINDGSSSGGSSAVTDHDAHISETATRARAAAALHNVVTAAAAALSSVDDETSRHEVRVLRLLEQVRAYCDQLRRRPAADDTPPLHVPGEMPPAAACSAGHDSSTLADSS